MWKCAPSWVHAVAIRLSSAGISKLRKAQAYYWIDRMTFYLSPYLNTKTLSIKWESTMKGESGTWSTVGVQVSKPKAIKYTEAINATRDGNGKPGGHCAWSKKG